MGNCRSKNQEKNKSSCNNNNKTLSHSQLTTLSFDFASVYCVHFCQPVATKCNIYLFQLFCCFFPYLQRVKKALHFFFIIIKLSTKLQQSTNITELLKTFIFTVATCNKSSDIPQHATFCATEEGKQQQP